MAEPSDQEAAESAERAGGRLRTPVRPKLYAMDAATFSGVDRFSFVESPGIMLDGDALPPCEACGFPALFTRPPTRAAGERSTA